MPGSITLSLGGYTIVFALTVLLLMAILFGIFFYRQIRRLRNNSTHKEINSTVASELRKKAREIINKKIDDVWAFKLSHFPPLTDCLMIAEHANAPHVCRMIAFDEVFRDIDRQLELINPEVLRRPGESTYSFLTRVKKNLFPDLSDSLIARLGYLHESCRFRTDLEFGTAQLSELRDHLKEFVRLLNNNRATLTSLNLVISKSRSVENKPNSAFNDVNLTSGFIQPIDQHNLSKSQEEMPLLGEYNASDYKKSSGPFLLSKPASELPQNNLKSNSVDDLPNGLVDVAQTIFQKFGKLMGYSGNCLNNGYKAPDGDCQCKQYFSGDRCEMIECLNNGSLDRHPDPEQRRCVCPSPQYISGRHCEIVNCENGGRDIGNGSCKCIDDWYTGQFCEFYSSSWLAVLGVPLVCLVVIIGCCVFCRADFFSKPREEPENRHRNRRHSTSRRPQEPSLSNPVVVCQASRSVTALEYDPTPPPVYNEPSNISDLFKTFEPPPSYDVAVQCRVISASALPYPNQDSLNIVRSSVSPANPNLDGDSNTNFNQSTGQLHSHVNPNVTPPLALNSSPQTDLRPGTFQGNASNA